MFIQSWAGEFTPNSVPASLVTDLMSHRRVLRPIWPCVVDAPMFCSHSAASWPFGNVWLMYPSWSGGLPVIDQMSVRFGPKSAVWLNGISS